MEGCLVLRFAHVGLVVHDLDRMCAFYRALGFSEFFRIRRDEPWIGEIVGLPSADIEIVHLATANDGCRIELLHYRFPGQIRTQGIRRTHLSLWTDDIDTHIGRALNAGAKILSLTSESSKNTVTIPDGPNKGMRVVYLVDPEDNIVEMMQRPQAIPDRTRALLDYTSSEARE
jgi:catechol 2,3-dioxygenase-like lactoylglutathione lyase family enzyme